MWAFWFAIAHHISHLHPEMIFFSYERNETIMKTVHNTRMHPYFFPGITLPNNVHCIDDILQVIKEVNMIIIAIPIPFVEDFIVSSAPHMQSGVIFLNCSKGIDSRTLYTVSDMLAENIKEIPYSYAVLSGGMIASELISGAPLGATVWFLDSDKITSIRNIFESPKLALSFTSEYKNIELFGAIKNIFALYTGYLEGKWLGMSTVGYAISQLYRELPELLALLGWSREIHFSDFALGGDLIATCFWESRNRYFGQLVWSGKTSLEAVEQLRWEKKHAEWYETLRWISAIIQKNNLVEFQKIVEVFFPKPMNS